MRPGYILSWMLQVALVVEHWQSSWLQLQWSLVNEEFYQLLREEIITLKELFLGGSTVGAGLEGHESVVV